MCSAADLRKVKYNIQAIGVNESLFSALVTGSDVTRKKPFPDIYLEGARRIHMDPKDCLVVEDALSGIRASAKMTKSYYFPDSWSDLEVETDTGDNDITTSVDLFSP